MSTNLSSLIGVGLQRAVLHELMESARDKPAEQTARRPAASAPLLEIPDAVRDVLTDARAETVIPRLLAVNAVRLQLDINSLAQACAGIKRQWWEDSLLNYFVCARASSAMVQIYFRHVSRTRVERLRRELGVTPPAKPSALGNSELARVFDIWSDLSRRSLDERERYVQLHRGCEGRHTLATLFAAIRIGDERMSERATGQFARAMPPTREQSAESRSADCFAANANQWRFADATQST
ncbi:MAG: hypothetical protein EPN57_26685 [Paraburkholderia sp.]|nr:MAG: hypothetical protein EPN57_26685 [Paraburkholderia sp.]